MKWSVSLLLLMHCCPLVFAQHTTGGKQVVYSGNYFSGTGDSAYLHLLDQAYRMMQPDPELENLSFLYKPEWNGFVEGPTWKYWWIQNSFGPTYAMLPFMDKAYQTFIYNSQALWFNVIGNGVRKDNNHFVGPEGVLVDCARDSPTDYFCKQGDYQVNIHDWPFGFTTAGLLLESELLLIRRDKAEIRHYLPLLESNAEFVDSRRDTVKNIFLIGTAGNLLAPGYAGSGVQKADGSYEMAYLAEISVNYIAALTRLTELEKMAGHDEKVRLYTQRIQKLEAGLSYFTTSAGYFIKSLDQDGTRHGEFGSPKHGYFETTPNQDAMAFRVADDRQANLIYQQIRSIPDLRPHDLILPNYPSYDDLYDTAGLFRFGEWVNGGHWTTCEARMQIGYYRVSAFDDACAAFRVMLKRAREFRLDNPLTDFGSKEYQPNIPVNCVYDSWGAPGGFLRGLFEYIYTADGLTLYPHIPPGIEEFRQNFPVYFGKRKIYLSVHGKGEITGLTINNQPAGYFGKGFISLKPESSAGIMYVSIGLGGAKPLFSDPSRIKVWHFIAPDNSRFWDINRLREKSDTAVTTEKEIDQLKRVAKFYALLTKQLLTETYEGKHAELILRGLQSIQERCQLKNSKTLTLLPAVSQIAADQLYIDAVTKQADGLAKHLGKCRNSGKPNEKQLAGLWDQAGRTR